MKEEASKVKQTTRQSNAANLNVSRELASKKGASYNTCM